MNTSTMSPTTLQLIDAAPILDALENIQRALAAIQADGLTASTGADAPAWLPTVKLGKHFGMERRRASMLLAMARSAGAIRCLRPPLPDGRPGTPIWNVADFQAFLARQNAPALL